VALLASSSDPAAVYREARGLVLQSHRKEIAALASLRRLAPRGRAAEFLRQASAGLESQLDRQLDALEKAYVAMTGQNPPNLQPSKEEREMARRVYVPVSDPGAWQDALDKLKPVPGLHPMMRFEVLNLADGRRSAYDIYETVSAEALSAGAWYYGSVSAADVLETLERAVKAGALSLKAGR